MCVYVEKLCFRSQFWKDFFDKIMSPYHSLSKHTVVLCQSTHLSLYHVRARTMPILLFILSPVPDSELSPMSVCLKEGRKEGGKGKGNKTGREI